MSQDRMDAQEETDSYEESMCNNHESGERRIPAEFSEIGRTIGSMTELIKIGKNKDTTTEDRENSSTMLI